MAVTDIRQLLPTDDFLAIINANAPTALNPFATIADIVNSSAFLIDTYANWDAKRIANGGAGTLPAGQWVKISDRGDTGIIIFCDTTNKFQEPNSFGGFLNADFENVGDYSAVEDATGIPAGTRQGVWRQTMENVTIVYNTLAGGNFSAGDVLNGTTAGDYVVVSDNGVDTLVAYHDGGNPWAIDEIFDNGSGVSAKVTTISTPTIALGNMTIWNNNHFQLTNADELNGDNPENNTNAYTPLSRGLANAGYVEVWDNLVYFFADDGIFYREDKYNNKVPAAVIPYFPFGDNDVNNVIINSTSIGDGYVNFLNNRGTVTGAIYGNNPTANCQENDSDIFLDMNGIDQTVSLYQNQSPQQIHLTGVSSGARGDNCTGSAVLYVYDESTVTFHRNAGTIKGRYNDESIVDHSDNAGVVDYGEFKNGCNVTLKLNSGKSHISNVYSGITQIFDNTSSVSNRTFVNIPTYDNPTTAASGEQSGAEWKTSGGDITFLGGVANIVLVVP